MRHIVPVGRVVEPQAEQSSDTKHHTAPEAPEAGAPGGNYHHEQGDDYDENYDEGYATQQQQQKSYSADRSVDEEEFGRRVARRNTNDPVIELDETDDDTLQQHHPHDEREFEDSSRMDTTEGTEWTPSNPPMNPSSMLGNGDPNQDEQEYGDGNYPEDGNYNDFNEGNYNDSEYIQGEASYTNNESQQQEYHETENFQDEGDYNDDDDYDEMEGNQEGYRDYNNGNQDSYNENPNSYYNNGDYQNQQGDGNYNNANYQSQDKDYSQEDSNRNDRSAQGDYGYATPEAYYNEETPQHQYHPPQAYQEEADDDNQEYNGMGYEPADDSFAETNAQTTYYSEDNEEAAGQDEEDEEEEINEYTEHTYEDAGNDVEQAHYSPPAPKFGLSETPRQHQNSAHLETNQYQASAPRSASNQYQTSAPRSASNQYQTSAPQSTSNQYQTSASRSTGNQHQLEQPSNKSKDRFDDSGHLESLDVRRAHRWTVVWAITSCILLIALIILVPFLLLRDDDDDNKVGGESSPTQAPNTMDKATPTPTAPPSTSGPRTCFTSTQELQDAVDQYLATDTATTRVKPAWMETYGSPIGTWCVSKITNFNSLFSADRNPAAMTFNADISRWDMSNATDLGSFLEGAREFDGDLSGWNVGRVRNLTRTFASTQRFNSSLSQWNTGLVQELRGTFFRATAFNQDIKNWDVSKVLTMREMFLYATSFNRDVSSWMLDSIISMNSMFAEASSFRQNMCSWGKQLETKLLPVDVSNMFENTQCPLGIVSPNLASSPAGPFCFPCISSAWFPSRAPTKAPVLAPVAVPATNAPTKAPVVAPAAAPTVVPVATAPTVAPVVQATNAPAIAPNVPLTWAPVVVTPTTSPTVSQSEIYTLICSQIPDCSVLLDPTTPQGKAFAWLGDGNFFSSAKKIQRYALATIYYSTDGDQWIDRTFWLSSVDECLWFSTASGPTCGPSRELIALELDRNIVFGQLPYEVSLLKSLQSLSFQGNGLSGLIPSELGNLTNLKTLLLNANFLSGPVPSSLSSLTGLSRLRLDNNNLGGLLPSRLCDLTSSASQLSIFIDCEEVTAPCFTTCCSNEVPCA